MLLWSRPSQNPNASLQQLDAEYAQNVENKYVELRNQQQADYAPFINAVFVNPALHANDVVKSETKNMLGELDKKIPNQKIKVTTYRDGAPVAEKMSIREIVGHIIDERRTRL